MTRRTFIFPRLQKSGISQETHNGWSLHLHSLAQRTQHFWSIKSRVDVKLLHLVNNFKHWSIIGSCHVVEKACLRFKTWVSWIDISVWDILEILLRVYLLYINPSMLVTYLLSSMLFIKSQHTTIHFYENETLKLLNWMEGYKNYDDSMSSKRKEYIEPILISKY